MKFFKNSCRQKRMVVELPCCKEFSSYLTTETYREKRPFCSEVQLSLVCKVRKLKVSHYQCQFVSKIHAAHKKSTNDGLIMLLQVAV